MAQWVKPNTHDLEFRTLTGRHSDLPGIPAHRRERQEIAEANWLDRLRESVLSRLKKDLDSAYMAESNHKGF